MVKGTGVLGFVVQGYIISNITKTNLMQSSFMRILTILLATFLLSSCVPEAEHNKVLSERDALKKETDSLKKEIEGIKFGAPNLLADGKSFFDAKDYKKAKEKLDSLVKKHPEMPQTIEAKKILGIVNEEVSWEKAANSNESKYIDEYLTNYPKGKFYNKAKARKTELKALNQKKAYDLASTQNNSSSWKKFLEDYPNHPQASAIKKKIIRCEVDEIMGSSLTGKMPSSEQYGNGSSSSSSVKIKNDTGCELTVRYSGPDAQMITIPSGGTRSIHLANGSYKVAASACGANYGGSEDLHGSYGSSFYISHSRY